MRNEVLSKLNQQKLQTCIRTLNIVGCRTRDEEVRNKIFEVASKLIQTLMVSRLRGGEYGRSDD